LSSEGGRDTISFLRNLELLSIIDVIFPEGAKRLKVGMSRANGEVQGANVLKVEPLIHLCRDFMITF